MNEIRYTTGKIISDLLLGLMVVVLFVAFLAATFGLGHIRGESNNQKVQNMTRYCIEKGYDGWTTETDGGRYESGDAIYCYRDK